MIIWRFTDGKAGHEAQSQGLVEALQQRCEVTVYTLPVQRAGAGLFAWLSRRYRPGAQLPAPDLLLGAGHATHWHLLAARRRYGGRAVLLMKPSLPLSWFDLCLVPEHDAPAPADNVLVTQGVLNKIQPGHVPREDTGLIVLGGPSRHFRWDDASMLAQLEQLVAARPRQRWLLATSRRTPHTLLQALLDHPAFDCMPWQETAPGWLAQQLVMVGEVWVSEDSVSMLYEALSAAAPVGLLQVARRGSNRVTAGIDALVARGWVSAPGDWQLAAGPPQPLNEAQRCADWILEQWLTRH